MGEGSIKLERGLLEKSQVVVMVRIGSGICISQCKFVSLLINMTSYSDHYLGY